MGYNRLPEFIDESVAEEVMQRLDAIERPAKKPRERWLAELKPKVLSLHNEGVSVKEIYDSINSTKRLIAEKEIQKMIGKATKRRKAKAESEVVAVSAREYRDADLLETACEPAFYRIEST